MGRQTRTFADPETPFQSFAESAPQRPISRGGNPPPDGLAQARSSEARKIEHGNGRLPARSRVTEIEHVTGMLMLVLLRADT